MNIALEWLPTALVIIYFLWKERVFVTQAQLLKAKEELLAQIENKYATKELANNIKEDIKEIKEQLKTISDFLLEKIINLFCLM